jgi:hypothetical protein
MAKAGGRSGRMSNSEAIQRLMILREQVGPLSRMALDKAIDALEKQEAEDDEMLRLFKKLSEIADEKNQENKLRELIRRVAKI